jgi:hypothetical protein
VASGTYRIAAIQAAFRRAARRLEHLASRHYSGGSSASSMEAGSSVDEPADAASSSGGGSAAGWPPHQQRQQQRINYLEGLFNVQKVLSRGGGGGGRAGGRGGRLSDKALELLDGGGFEADEYYLVGGAGSKVGPAAWRLLPVRWHAERPTRCWHAPSRRALLHVLILPPLSHTCHTHTRTHTTQDYGYTAAGYSAELPRAEQIPLEGDDYGDRLDVLWEQALAGVVADAERGGGGKRTKRQPRRRG